MLDVAIVGLGRAGRARQRALAAHPRARLAAVARRSPGEGEWSFDELVSRADELDAAIVCTPNLVHAATTRALLEASLHIAVEFPLADNADTARALFALAARRGKVLHVEHIELLAPGHRALRAVALDLGRPRGGEVRFQGGVEGYVGVPSLAGSPALLASARLHRLVDLFGDATVASARLDARGTGYRLEVELAFASGGHTTLLEERATGLRRGTSFAVECERGPAREPAGGGAGDRVAGDLFRSDLDLFLDRVEGHGEATVSEEREIHVLGLIAAIDQRIT